MNPNGTRPPTGRIEPFDRAALESRLRKVATATLGRSGLDEQELRHLIRVVSACSLLMTDVYSPARIERIMHPERRSLATLVHRLIAEERDGEGEVFYRVRRLPDDVRLVGDKALFDLGLLGVRQVQGYDLHELGTRAYRMASEVLELLAEDRRLREFFRHNRLLMLPLEQEVDFLRQVSERFDVYSDLLRRAHEPEPAEAALETLRDDLRQTIPWMAAAADALADAGEDSERRRRVSRYVEAAKGTAHGGDDMSRDELLSAYERMLRFASLDPGELRRGLTSVVVDQDAAVGALIDEFGLIAAGTRDLRRPAAFFLVGPTGVGKNHLVETLTRLLEGVWGVEVPFLTIEGPNYTYPSDINELRGATRGFIRSDEEGLLSAFHERSSRAPFSILLVDEVEKAHPQLRTFFLSILDRGTTTDNRGRVLNFSNSIVFFTSNLGYSDAMQRAAPIGYGDEDARGAARRQEIARDLRKTLTPEFVNRVRLLHFSPLGRGSVERILDLELERIGARYREVHGIELRLSAEARAEFIDRGFSPKYGARHMAATLERVANVEIARRLRQDDRRPFADRERLVAWLRRVRSGDETADLAEIRARVLEGARADVGYGGLEIAFDGERFVLRPIDGTSGVETS